MRDQTEIKRDIEVLQQEIRYARAEGDFDINYLYADLDQLYEELLAVRTMEQTVRRVSSMQV